jgi:hypothetical protein
MRSAYRTGYVVDLPDEGVHGVVVDLALLQHPLQTLHALAYLGNGSSTFHGVSSCADRHAARRKNMYLSMSYFLNSPYFLISS